MRDEVWFEKLQNAAELISEQARISPNEATIASVFDISLFNLIHDKFGLVAFPIKEQTLHSIRRIARGRLDSSYGAFVIEFKQPSTLRTNNLRLRATGQLTDYLVDLWDHDGANYLGLVTDGIQSQFVRIEQGMIHDESWMPLSTPVLDRIVRATLSLEQIALSSRYLVRDFCEPWSSSLFRRIARHFYSVLRDRQSERTLMLYQEWRELFRLGHGDKTQQVAIRQRKEALAEIFELDASSNDAEYRMLYALQTTYALIVKLIAYKVISDVYFETGIVHFDAMSTLTSRELRVQLERLENGAVFRDAGVLNLLEGDFFSWYAKSNQWNAELGGLVVEILRTLSKYENKVLTAESNAARDIFKDLYQSIIPAAVRHSLGEFYTPPWLADLLITEAFQAIDGIDEWRALDPCAGSGTFITKLIERIFEQTEGQEPSARLDAVLSRVFAIDLNPLAVLTTRVNYFINISPLISDSEPFEIPVYLGDSSYVPARVVVESVDCFEYEIRTLKGPLPVVLPHSALNDLKKFSTVMTKIETQISLQSVEGVVDLLHSLCAPVDLTPNIVERFKRLARQLVELEELEWNGIWARIVTNFLSTAGIGRVDLIVGNPPWIDWKNLPQGYRERIKGLCLDRNLFSGDRVTGGINLNICALIANVAADNWLSDAGVLAFLMPESLLLQQTYEGFRNFRLPNTQRRLYLSSLLGLTEAGHPFKPVQHRFMGYLYSGRRTDYARGLAVKDVRKMRGLSIEAINQIEHWDIAKQHFSITESIVGAVNPPSTAFTFAPTRTVLNRFRSVAGECQYIGREGIEFYPQELFLLEVVSGRRAPQGKAYLRNFQSYSSRYSLGEEIILLETEFLHPLIKGIDVKPFALLPDRNFVVPFPYDPSTSVREPLDISDLTQRAPLLAAYLTRHTAVLDRQTQYNSRIIGRADHASYALARVGAYSFQDVHVVYRDNTSWQASVAEPVNTPWGARVRPLFQNHAPSICEKASGGYISVAEAHFIAACLNAPTVRDYMMSSSDSRTFKIRPPVHVPHFDVSDPFHEHLSSLGRAATSQNAASMISLLEEIDDTFLELCNRDKRSNT